MQNMPWFIKVFIALGGLGLVWGFISKGIPQLVAWLLPKIITLVDKLLDWLLSKPAVRSAVVKYKPQIMDFLKQLFDAINKIGEAVEEEIEKKVEETQDQQ